MEMGPELAREIFWIQLIHLVALLAVILTNLTFMDRGGKNPVLFRYLQIQACLCLWIVAKIMKTVSPGVDVRWAWIVVQYAGVSALGPSFFHFAFRYSRRRDPRGVVLLYAAGAAFFAAFATNPAHHLYYETYSFYDDTFGPLFYVHSAFTYGLIAIGTAMIARGFGRARVRSRAALMIAVSALVPLSVNVMYVLRIIRPLFDITPIAMSLSLALFAVAAFRYGFLGVLPFARGAVVRGLPDPVRVVSPRGDVVYDTLPAGAVPEGGDFQLYRSVERRGHRIELYADVSRVRGLEREYDERNGRLEGLNDRLERQAAKRRALHEANAYNESRRELHDILGHSITLIIVLARTAASTLRSDPERARAILRQAGEQAHAGLTELGTEARKGLAFVSEAIDGILEAYQDAELNVEASFSGHETAVAPAIVHAVRRCCQECLANAIKHAGASNVFIGAAFRSDRLVVTIVDDGDGADAFRPGEGLSMMRDRLSTLGGELRVFTAPGDGFQVAMTLPLDERAGAR